MNPIRLIVAVGAVGAAVVVGGLKVANVFDSASSAVSQATGGGSPAGASGDSLIRTENYAKALDTLRAKAGSGGEVLEMRLEPGKVTWQVRKGGSAEGWELQAGSTDLSGFGVDLFGPGKVEDNMFPLARLAPEVPEKLVAAIRTRHAGVGLDGVSFMTLDTDAVTGEPQSSVNAGGGLYQADLDGSNLHQPGDGAGAAAPATTTGGAPSAADQASRPAACLQAAGADVAEIQACTP